MLIQILIRPFPNPTSERQDQFIVTPLRSTIGNQIDYFNEAVSPNTRILQFSCDDEEQQNPIRLFTCLETRLVLVPKVLYHHLDYYDGADPYATFVIVGVRRGYVGFEGTVAIVREALIQHYVEFGAN